MARNQTNNGGGWIWMFLMLVVMVAAIAGGFAGFNPWLMVVAAVVGVMILAVCANLHDIARYLRIRSM